MEDVVRDGWRRNGKLTQVHPGDVEWWRASVGGDVRWAERVALWETPPGRTVGWTVFLPPGELDWFVHPRDRTEPLRRAMLEWFTQQVRSLPPAAERPERLTVWTAACDPGLMRMLAEEGYERSPDWFVHRARDLRAADAPVREPIPEGYEIRNVEGEDDIDRRAAVHRAAFRSSEMTTDRYRVVMASPLYRSDLDVVAVAPDGEFAAFCLLWLDPVTKVTLLEPVGTHPDHQRRGLARAVCSEGLRQAAALGSTVATVLAWSEEEAANRLYRGLGFQEFMHSYRYRKPLIGDATPAT